jgi:hypothetical protein
MTKPLARVTVGNFKKWGLLVKTWATGIDHVQDGTAYPMPTTLGEFREQVKRAGADMTIPERITALQMVPGDDHTLVVRLPPGQMILDSEAKLTEDGSHPGGEKYPLPEFYARLWYGKPQMACGTKDLLDVHAERIGEYTINNCM